MAFKYYGDLMFSTGEYEKDGKKKKNWTKAGAVFKDSETGGISIKMEAMPMSPDWSGWLRIFARETQQKHETSNDEPINLAEIPF